MEIATIIEKFGLPVGLLIYFIWRDYQTGKEHKADMRSIAVQSVQAIDKGTDAINDGVKVIEANNTAISNNSDILSRVQGVLSVGDRSRQNGNGN